MAEPRTLTASLDQRREAERRKYLKLASASSRYGGTNHGRDAYTTVIGWMPRFVVDFGCGDNAFIFNTCIYRHILGQFDIQHFPGYALDHFP